MRSPKPISAHLALATAVAAIVLVPYATVAFEFRTALLVQAGSILAVLAVLALLSLRSGALRGLGRALRNPGPIGWGAYAYAAAGALGCAVGFGNGNAPVLIAGQALSLALLPLALAVGSLTARETRARSFSTALAYSAGAVTILHLLLWIRAIASGERVFRFALDNSVTLSGSALMALLCALAVAGSEKRGRRFLGATCAVLIAIFIVGSGVRGLWIVTPIALAIFVLFAGYGGKRLRSVAASALLAIVLAGGAIAATAHWLERPRTEILQINKLAREMLDGEIIEFAPRDMRFPHIRSKAMRRAARRQAMQFERKRRKRGVRYTVKGRLHLGWSAADPEAVFVRRPIESAGSYRLSAKIKSGSDKGRGSLGARWLDEEGAPIGQLTLAIAPSRAWREVSGVGLAPEGTASVELVASAWGSDRTWRLDKPRLERIASGSMAPVLSRMDYFYRRFSSLAALSSAEGVSREQSIAVRVAESQALLELFGAAPLGKKLLGHGLGATFQVPDFDPVRPAVEGEVRGQNYIHNYYAFLLFKLGVVGTVLALGALILWLKTTFGWARSTEPGPERRFLAASGAAWAGYLVLSLSSPEILDFRIAPLWGLLLAATLACRPRDG